MAAKKAPTFAASERITAAHLMAGAQIWAYLISTGGGAVAHHKSMWQMLAWLDGTFPPQLKDLSTHTVTLDNGFGVKTEVTQKKSLQTNKGLGCRQAPTNQQTEEHKHRQDQCQEIADKISTRRINLKYMHNMFHTRIIPKTAYSMATTSFTTKECAQLNTILDKAVLPKMRYNRHTPKAVLYAPLSRGRAGYPSFEVIQDQKGIMTMLRNLRWDETMSKDILVTLSAIQLYSGLCKPILEDVTTALDYIPQGWIARICHRLNAMNATMWVEHQWCPKLQRVEDQPIMVAIARVPGITKKMQEKCNYCKLFARVITIADIAIERGDAIPGNWMNGEWQAPSSLEWPRLPCPPSDYWAIFRRFMRRAFSSIRRPGRLHHPVRLDMPLGAWNATTRRVRYKFYRTQMHAYRRTAQGFIVYDHHERRVFHRATQCTSIPSSAHPIDARYNEDELWTIARYASTTTMTCSNTFINRITPVRGPNMAGSDGSVHPVTGDRACAYAVQLDGVRYEGAKRYQRSKHSTSFRSELEGIKCTLDVINELTTTESLHQHVDNEQAV